MRKSALVRPCSRHFRDAPDFGLPTPKSGYGFSTRKSPLRRLGGADQVSYTGGPPRALYTDMVQCLLDNLNG
jgi:hypothetical protein